MSAREDPANATLGTILFATDFSPSSERAGHYVRSLANRFSSRVLLVHVVNLVPAFQSSDAGICIDLFRKSSEESLAIAKEQFLRSGIQAETILSESVDPAKELLLIEKERNPDLMVIGTRGHEGLSLVALGSTAETLVHRAKCPVFTVGPRVEPPAGDLTLGQIICATDFSPEAAQAFSFVQSLALANGSHVYLCHVLPDLNRIRGIQTMDLIQNFNTALRQQIPDAAREWCEPECVVDHGDAVNGILLLAHRIKADLIALGTRRASDWLGNVKAGIAYGVIRAAACPVLTIRG